MKGKQQDLRAREIQASTWKSPLSSLSTQLKFRLPQSHNKINCGHSLYHQVPATMLTDPFLRCFGALPAFVRDIRRHVEGSEKCQNGHEVMETHGSGRKGANRGQDSSIYNQIGPGCHRWAEI